MVLPDDYVLNITESPCPPSPELIEDHIITDVSGERLSVPSNDSLNILSPSYIHSDFTWNKRCTIDINSHIILEVMVRLIALGWSVRSSPLTRS
jgi:hypothetical protein